MSDVLMSQARFAKVMGVSRQYINQLVQRGAIPLYGDGKRKKLKVSEAKAAIESIKDPSREPQREANRKKKRQADAHLFAPEVAPEKSLADMTQEERAEYDRRLLEERRKLDELKREAEKSGVDIEIDTNGATLNEVKVFKELYQGKLAQLEYRKRSGELLEKSEVERDAMEIAKLVRSSFDALPHNLAMRIAPMSDPREIEALMEAEIQNILHSLYARVDR